MRGKMQPKAALRRLGSAILFRPLWEYIQAGGPQTVEAELFQFSARWWQLRWGETEHWHNCGSCGEGTEERVCRLLRLAIEQGAIELTDNEGALEYENARKLISILDEIEQPPTLQWWRSHYAACSGRLAAIEESHDAIKRGEAQQWPK